MTSTGKTGLTILLCVFVAIFEGIDLQAAGLAVPQIKAEFALVAGQLGAFTAASSVGLLFGSLAGGRIADRLGRRITLTGAIILFGIASIVTAWSNGFEMLVATRFVTGLGLGGALPNLVALVSENSAAAWKARAVGIMYAGFPLGGALASAIMASLAAPGSAVNAVLTSAGLHAGDWRAIFYTGGIAPLLAVPLIILALPDSVEFTRLAAAGQQLRITGWGKAVFGEGRLVNSLLLWVSFFSTLLVLYLLLNWLPSLLNARGFDRSQSFLVQLTFNGGGVPGAVVAGILMDSARRNLTVPFIYGGAVVTLVLVALMPTDITIALTLGAILGAFVMGTQALLYGMAPACYHTAIRGTGVGTAVCIGRLGSVAGPLLAASLVGAGHTPAQVLMGLVPLASIGGITAVILTARAKHATPP